LGEYLETKINSFPLPKGRKLIFYGIYGGENKFQARSGEWKSLKLFGLVSGRNLPMIKIEGYVWEIFTKRVKPIF